MIYAFFEKRATAKKGKYSMFHVEIHIFLIAVWCGAPLAAFILMRERCLQWNRRRIIMLYRISGHNNRWPYAAIYGKCCRRLISVYRLFKEDER
jgi:hypothetical protein